MSEVSRSNTYFLLAAFNEESQIERVVGGITGAGYGCVVVDDGSSDRTREVLGGTAATVISHPFNLGQGAALKTGFKYLVGKNVDYVVTFDADGQHNLEDAEFMLNQAHATGSQVVLGSRFLGGQDNSHIPFHRRIVLRLGVAFTRLHTGLRVSDTHNGLRVISGEALKVMDLHQPRMAHASEILQIIAQKNIGWFEAPVKITYSRETIENGQSSFSGAITIVWDLLIGRLRR